MKQLLVTAALLGLVFAGCAEPANVAEPEPQEPARQFPASPEGVTRFLVIGDQGTGASSSYRQHEVAKAMHDACVARGCEFVLALGDNIYNDGPNPSSGVYDDQFDEKFEIPYADFDIPFYLVLGNHDNGNGGGTNAAIGDIEVAYTYREDRPSDKWNMPARWYSFEAGNAQFFALDSGPDETSSTILWDQGTLGPAMQTWYRDAMAQSSATWKFGFAHHPYISNGQHGNAGLYDASPGRGLSYKLMLDEIMCGETDIFFAGHDHDLQWLQALPTCDTEFIISGAAAKERARRLNADNLAHFEAYETYGFLWAEIEGNRFTGTFIGMDGQEMYSRTLTK